MSLEKSEIISEIERRLEVRYVRDLSKGHMGASIILLEKLLDKSMLIAKFCSKTDPKQSLADIVANIYGYEALEQISASNIIPNKYQVEVVGKNPVIIMSFLDATLRASIQNSQNPEQLFAIFAKKFTQIVRDTASDDVLGEIGTNSVNETMKQIQFYTSLLKDFIDRDFKSMLMENQFPPIKRGKVAIFLLDFTPDNLFLSSGGLEFIDPWQQSTYLGHPTVSLGQFITLARDVYKLPGSKVGCGILTTTTFSEIASILDSDIESIRRMACMGQTLQFLLSAYVRMGTNSDESRIYTSMAKNSFRAMQQGNDADLKSILGENHEQAIPIGC